MVQIDSRCCQRGRQFFQGYKASSLQYFGASLLSAIWVVLHKMCSISVKLLSIDFASEAFQYANISKINGIVIQLEGSSNAGFSVVIIFRNEIFL